MRCFYTFTVKFYLKMLNNLSLGSGDTYRHPGILTLHAVRTGHLLLQGNMYKNRGGCPYLNDMKTIWY